MEEDFFFLRANDVMLVHCRVFESSLGNNTYLITILPYIILRSWRAAPESSWWCSELSVMSRNYMLWINVWCIQVSDKNTLTCITYYLIININVQRPITSFCFTSNYSLHSVEENSVSAQGLNFGGEDYEHGWSVWYLFHILFW